MNGLSLDAGGLIALDRDDRRVNLLLKRAVERGERITVSATVLAQVIRNPARQARLNRFIRQAETNIISLSGDEASAVGVLLAQTATTDIADAHVVLCAQRAGHPILTSDVGDLLRIDPEIQLIKV